MNFMTNKWRGLIACMLVFGLAGCQQDGKSRAKTQSSPTPSTNATKSSDAAAPMAPATTANPEPAQPVQSVAHTPPPTTPSPAPSPDEDFESEAARRKQTENMIYATIRIKMEEAIEKRAALLKSGRDPADQEVRSLEGTIMRARELLEENGEVVEPVDPPIVQSVPNP
jgi:type IV secretory pathway VirB10-like protein